MHRKPAAFLVALLAATPAAFAADCRVASGPGTAALVELYTSEGCSSCPPADRWISGFTARQEAGAKVSGARFVYTPQVVVGGRDLPGWHDDARFARGVEEIHRRPARATLELAPRTAADGTVSGIVTADLRPGLPAKRLALVVAVLQDGLSSRVTAGENRGERLAHDFVARDLAIVSVPEGRSTHAFEFKARPGWEAARMSVAAFLQDTGTGEVVQALAAPPCPQP